VRRAEFLVLGRLVLVLIVIADFRVRIGLHLW
jgi:hypothetical protein